jgi:hypothetical protein
MVSVVSACERGKDPDVPQVIADVACRYGEELVPRVRLLTDWDTEA